MLESFGEGEEETSYEDMTRMCGLEFDELFLGSVYFQIGTSSWQTELKTIFDKFRTDSK